MNGKRVEVRSVVGACVIFSFREREKRRERERQRETEDRKQTRTRQVTDIRNKD